VVLESSIGPENFDKKNAEEEGIKKKNKHWLTAMNNKLGHLISLKNAVIVLM